MGILSKEEIAKYTKLFSGVLEGKTLVSISSLGSLKADSKRVQVIDGDTLLDVCFKEILTLYFSQSDKNVMKLFEPSIGGPLVSLTHKARLAYALGLIDKTTMNDSEYMHKIRNEFAHSIDASFTKTRVIKLVGKLSTVKNHEVTARNSYRFYNSAIAKCWRSFSETFKQEANRQAMLKEVKKTKKAKIAK